jgi:hypothetical protein
MWAPIWATLAGDLDFCRAGGGGGVRFTQRREGAKERQGGRGMDVEEGRWGKLIIEIKCVDRLAPVHTRQLLTYLRLAKLPLGLLMNFGGETFAKG